jgi:G protein-coupled receptor 157
MAANISGTDLPCPGVINCSQHKDLVSFDLGRVPSYISISSSTLSCLGSCLIVYAYFSLKDIRTGAQKVITLLAVADFFTAFGYIAGSVNFITHFNQTAANECKIFKDLCEIQSFVTTWSTMCSYCWTCILAFYFFLILVFNKSSLAARLIPVYNIFAWIGPLLIVLPLLLTGNLGFAPYVASNWCYIKDTTDYGLLHNPKTISLLFVGGKLWEILSYLTVIVLYVWIRVFLSKVSTIINSFSFTLNNLWIFIFT